MVQLNNDNILNIQNKLKSLLNTAIILETLYKPIQELVEEKEYTLNEAINAKASADKYIEKYAVFNIRNAVNGIADLLKDNTPES